VGVDVPALGDVGDDLADVLAVLDGGVARLEVLQRDLVADGHIGAGGQAEGGIVMGDAAQHVGAGGQALDHDDADIVGLVMDQQVRDFGCMIGHVSPGWLMV
jgi:hypothetical protein